MDKKNKKKLKAKLDALAKEHKQDLTDPLYQALVVQVIAVIELHELMGISCEILGAESGDGFFEFDIKKIPKK